MKSSPGLLKFKQSLKRLSPLIGALLLGLMAAGLGWYYLRASEREIAASLEKDADSQRRDVVVARQPIGEGSQVLPGMVAKRSVPNEYLHNDALTPESFAQFAGRQLTVPVAAGKPLLASFFAAPRKVFAQEIEQGVRAVTIPVDEISSISGMLRAGDRIDFMYVVEKSAANDPSVVIPLLQDVEVRATGQITSEQFAAMRKRADVSADTDPYARQRYATVTVAVQPQDAQKLILAQRLGKIIATLRNPEDRATMTTGVDAVDLDAIVSGFRPQRAVPVAASHAAGGSGVEYIVGGRSGGGGAMSPGLGQARSQDEVPSH
ncbi:MULTISPECIES: Flp pilus assembly protein CpaB [Variovorax]|uniref:Flp pilus assembly protein CpaB n=1 Tax=Variovorax paradoxus (strain EPS) TaxID=595537 RepID=E6V213_VARPE|nr:MULTISPECIES: Flp pilus assembly protein CpaB [Variovorax]ADU39092.1 Flp pilus assembly protein CpaB [Variovorax paradoxus EPS]MDQ0043673.1 pilus assembly protein CpaB [Variovorax boronicumulans]